MTCFYMPRKLIIVTCSFFKLCHLYFLFHFVGHIYVVVSILNDAWGSDYWLVHFLDGKQTFLEPVIDDENNEFLTGSMAVKSEYLTLASHTKKYGYVY